MFNILVLILSLMVYAMLLKVFGYSLKNLIQIFINAGIGLIALYVVNQIGIAIKINWLSIMITVFFGLPGVIVMLISNY